MEEPVRPRSPFTFLRDILSKLKLPLPGSVRPGGGEQAPFDLDAAILRAQVEVIRRAFKKAGMDVAGAPGEGSRPPHDDAEIHYLYRPGHALVSRRDYPRLEEFFGAPENEERFSGRLEARETRVPQLVLAALPSRTDGGDDVLVTLNELEESRVIERGAVSPDHVLYVTGRGYLCPATEPEVTRSRRPWPPPAPYDKEITDEKTKIRVTVVDSGLWEPAVGSSETPWLEKGDVFAGPDDVEQVIPSKIH